MRILIILTFFYTTPALSQFDFKIETPKIEAPKIEAPKVEVQHEAKILESKKSELAAKTQNQIQRTQATVVRAKEAAKKTSALPLQVQLRKVQKKICRIPTKLKRNVKIGARRTASLKAGVNVKHSQINCN